MNIFKKFVKSIMDFESYVYFYTTSMGKAILYLIFITLLVGTLTLIKPLSISKATFRNFYTNVSDFSVQDGVFKAKGDMPMIIDNKANPTIVIDTTDNPDKSVVNKYASAVYVTKDTVAIKINNLKLDDFKFSGLKSLNFTKADLLENLYVENFFYVMIVVVFLVIFFLDKLVDALIIAIIGTIFRNIRRVKIRFGGLYRIGVYTLTLPSIVKMILMNYAVNIPDYFTFIYFGIAAVYMFMAIGHISQSQKVDTRA